MAETQTIISTEGDHITLINIFTCSEQRQDELVAALTRATQELFVEQPGFISANIHASLDRTRVVNYAQWATVEDFDAMRGIPAIREHMDHIMSIAASADPRLFQVRSVHHA
jgi:heme-degrading monooxygenase HmoA